MREWIILDNYLLLKFHILTYSDEVDKKKKNQLISWITAYKDGGLGLLQTIPEWRGEGCAKACINNLACHLESLDVRPHCFIEDGNISSESLFKKMGFVKTHNARWVILWDEAKHWCNL